MKFIDAYKYTAELRSKIEQCLMSYSSQGTGQSRIHKPSLRSFYFALINYLIVIRKCYGSRQRRIFFLNELYSIRQRDYYLYNTIIGNNDLIIGYTREIKESRENIYSIGLLNKIIVKFSLGHLSSHYVWMLLLYPILRKQKKEVFIHSFSNDLGLAVLGLSNVFEFSLSEIQHTSVRTYPPYKLSGIKGLNAFYYWNEKDMEFLMDACWAGDNVLFRKLPKAPYSIKKGEEREIFYIVTGDGPLCPDELFTFLQFSDRVIKVKVFNHPRRKVTREYLERNVGKSKSASIEIVEALKWFEVIHDEAILLCTSSTVAIEAIELQIPIIITGELGKERFKSHIDRGDFIYSTDLLSTIRVL